MRTFRLLTTVLVWLGALLPGGAQTVNPADYGNVVLHLRAEDLNLENGAPVTEWGPMTAGGTAAPAFVAADARFSDRPVVRFDGTSDYMTFSQADLTVRTVMAVVVVDAGAPANATLLSSGGFDRLIRRNASTTRYRSPGAAEEPIDFTAGTPGGSLAVNNVPNGTFTNGTAHLLTVTAGAPVNFSSLWIGNPGSTAGAFWRGAVAELILFADEPDEEARNAIAWYLQTRYGLPDPLPPPKPMIRAFEAVQGKVASRKGLLSSGPGAPVSLRWTVDNADAVSIDNGVLASSADGTGTAEASPAATTVFTLTATNAQGSSVRSVTVYVGETEQPVRINEIMADNDGTLEDEDGDSSDWIELFNPNPWAVDLHGLQLRDGAGAWDFPDRSLIEAEGFRVVFASGKDRSDPAGNLHTSFALSSSGEYLGLVRTGDGTEVSGFSPAFPAMGVNRSWGWYGSPPVTGYFGSPDFPATPGAENAGSGVAGFLDDVDDTKFLAGRGIYTGPVAETITCSTPGAKIIYTTDGSIPAPGNGTVVEAPDPSTPPSVSLTIHPGAVPEGATGVNIASISGTTTLRAAVFKDGYAPTNVDTQTYVFPAEVIRQSTATAVARGWPSGSVSGQVFKYAMNPAAVTAYGEQAVIESLYSLPAVSIVTPQANLTAPSSGIYVNAQEHGAAWERPVSVEFFLPPGYTDEFGNTEGFQIDAGLRIRGGYSRNSGFYKHGLRMYFARRYDGRLRYPMFGAEGTTEFGKLELAIGSNYGWFRENSYSNGRFNTMVRDPFCRDTQGALGQPNTRTRYVHLYLNGVYWGVHYIEERADGDYAAGYMGGSDDDYDVVKCGNHVGGFQTEVTNGSLESWRILWEKVRAIGTTDAGNDKYFELEGRNPDGSRNPAMPVLLDIDNLIDEMIVIFYSGDGDAVLSNFLGHNQPNNWWGLRPRDGAEGFRFFIRDAEHTLGAPSWVSNQTGPWTGSNQNSFRFSNPQWMHQDLMKNDEYRLRFADRVHRHFFNGGALTPEKSIARFLRRAGQVERAMTAESVRWGNAQSISGRPAGHPPYYTTDDWKAAIALVVNNILPNRTNTVLNQLRGTANRLYPTVAAPSFVSDSDGAPQHGGEVAPGFRLRIAAPAGQIYYTLDGSDPRAIGGAVAAGAVPYSGPVTLTEPVEVRARVLSGENWSALNAAHFNTGVVPASAANVVISEIHYNPPEGSDLEFLEILNVGTVPINLTGVSLRVGVTFDFPDNLLLPAGGRLVVAGNPEAFRARYPSPDITVLGPFGGNLSNGGERIALVSLTQGTIRDFTYSDGPPWPEEPDGSGVSLVLKSSDPSLDPSDPANWRAGTVPGGTPGSAEPGGSGFSGNPAADADSDGLNAFLEYALGSSDTDPASGPDAWSVEIRRLEVNGVTDDYPVLTFRRISDPGLTYGVETTEDLSGWSGGDAVVLLSEEPGPDGTVIQAWRTKEPVSGGDRRWIRLRVTGD